uniref:Pcd4 protein n=1 Tax=Vibrio cholerae TaxID=666 RepID=Q56642_VIBCL|nr:pcd4 [Vibrio cholerae]
MLGHKGYKDAFDAVVSSRKRMRAPYPAYGSKACIVAHLQSALLTRVDKGEAFFSVPHLPVLARFLYVINRPARLFRLCFEGALFHVGKLVRKWSFLLKALITGMLLVGRIKTRQIHSKIRRVGER